MRRAPAVAGQFYHGSASRLREQVEKLIEPNALREEVVGAIVPHAGLIYSGSVAGAVYSSIMFPKTFILLGPNHTGLGSSISLMEEGEWEIPTGIFEIDRKLAGKIIAASDLVSRDSRAHIFEHSLEVQLPFLAHFSSSVKIVPISVLSASLDECLQVGEVIAGAIKDVGYPVVLIASSDMSHYVPEKIAKKQDEKAIGKVLNLDPSGLYRIVLKERISMCGYLPATIMLAAANKLGAGSARLVKYATSGEVSGDYESVVGYAGIIVR